MPQRWYAAQLIHSGMLEIAEINLTRQNFTYFTPMALDGFPVEIEPLFPGYIFVNLDIDYDQWRSVNGTRGVVGLLPRLAERPQALPDGLVEELQAEGPRPLNEALATVTKYLRGDKIQVAGRHALAGNLGEVVSPNRRGRTVEVLLWGLRGTFLVERQYLKVATG